MIIDNKKLTEEDINLLKDYCILKYGYKNEILLAKYRDNKNEYNQCFEYDLVNHRYVITPEYIRKNSNFKDILNYVFELKL